MIFGVIWKVIVVFCQATYLHFKTTSFEFRGANFPKPICEYEESHVTLWPQLASFARVEPLTLSLPLFFFLFFDCKEDGCWYVWEQKQRGRESMLSGWISGLCLLQWLLGYKRWRILGERHKERRLEMYTTGTTEGKRIPLLSLSPPHKHKIRGLHLMEGTSHFHTSKHRTEGWEGKFRCRNMMSSWRRKWEREKKKQYSVGLYK